MNPGDLGDCTSPELIQKIKDEYKEKHGKDISQADLNKTLAAKAHPTAEGESFLNDPTTGKKNAYCHMISDKHGKQILDTLVTAYHEEAQSILDQHGNTKEAREMIRNCSSRQQVEEVCKNIACDDLLKDRIGETRFAAEAMRKIDEAATTSPKKMSTQERQLLVKEGIKTVINSPGNARIGDGVANNEVLMTRTL
jgi:hypothetical protein